MLEEPEVIESLMEFCFSSPLSESREVEEDEEGV